MDTTLHTEFSNAFSSETRFYFKFDFTEVCSCGTDWYAVTGLINVLAIHIRQIIAWINYDPGQWRHVALTWKDISVIVLRWW